MTIPRRITKFLFQINANANENSDSGAAAYEQPNSVYVAQRLGMPQITLLPAGALPGKPAPARAATLGVRTEHLMICAPDAADFPARVYRVEHLGDQVHVHLQFQGLNLITLASPAQSFDHDDEVGLRLVEPLYFDAEGARVAASA